MKKIIYKAEDRGNADHGWLKAHYSFSFGNHYNANKMGFGLLRVLNDDEVAPSMGFGKHPHDNMEIITIPLSGTIKHEDSMGNDGTISVGEVQIMSAGTGVSHSEFNPSSNEALKLFQIWIVPKLANIEPRYDQKAFMEAGRKNQFQLLVSPIKEEGALWINQNAWLSRGDFELGKTVHYTAKLKTNGIYLMVIEGDVEVDGAKLNMRDAVGISEADVVDIKVITNAQLLIIDVPMS